MLPDNTRESIIDDEAIRARVRHVVESPAPKRGLLDHPLTSIIVGFICTGIVGVVVSNCYQSKQEAGKRTADLAEARRTAALVVMDSLGAFLNRGYYIYYQYLAAMPAATRSERDTLAARRGRFAAYNEALKSRRLIDAARVCTFMGHSVEEVYTKAVISFQFLESDLTKHEQSLGAGPGRQRDSLRTADSLHLVTLQNRVYGVALAMAAAVTDSSLYERAHCAKTENT